MANVSNVNRQATARALASALETLKDVAGLVVQTHRAYESASRNGQGLTQDAVATQANCSQPTISNLEQGKTVPCDPMLSDILAACGLNMSAGHGGAGLLALLQLVRDHQNEINLTQDEQPS